jgi:hypothetical protein
MKYNIEKVFELLDNREENQSFIILPTINKQVYVNNRKNKILNAYYQRSKNEVIKCVCCGLEPTHIKYSTNHGLQLKIDNSNHMTLDHIIPDCLGGDRSQTNLQMMCFDCNNKKGSTFTITDKKLFKYDLTKVFDYLLNKYSKGYKAELYSLKRKLFNDYNKIVSYYEFEQNIFWQLKLIVWDLKMKEIRGIIHG